MVTNNDLSLLFLNELINIIKILSLTSKMVHISRQDSYKPLEATDLEIQSQILIYKERRFRFVLGFAFAVKSGKDRLNNLYSSPLIIFHLPCPQTAHPSSYSLFLIRTQLEKQNDKSTGFQIHPTWKLKWELETISFGQVVMIRSLKQVETVGLGHSGLGQGTPTLRTKAIS